MLRYNGVGWDIIQSLEQHNYGPSSIRIKGSQCRNAHLTSRWYASNLFEWPCIHYTDLHQLCGEYGVRCTCIGMWYWSVNQVGSRLWDWVVLVWVIFWGDCFFCMRCNLNFITLYSYCYALYFGFIRGSEGLRLFLFVRLTCTRMCGDPHP